MKKSIIVLAVLATLFLSSLAVLADPWALPGTDESFTYHPVTVVGESK